MKKKVSYSREFLKGLWDNNPVLIQLLGLCPALAVTTTAENGFGMAMATTFVLFFSSMLVSSLKKLIPSQVRIAAYILIIATFVTIVDILMKAKLPDLSKSLGAFIPLIVVNCLVLGRAEAFASKNGIFRAALDSLGMGVGFMLSLTTLGGIREILGSGTIFGITVLPSSFEPWIVMILPAGAFLTLGLMLGVVNFIEISKKEKKDRENMNKYLISETKTNTNTQEG